MLTITILHRNCPLASILTGKRFGLQGDPRSVALCGLCKYVSQCDYFFSLVILEVSILVGLVEILVLIGVVNKSYSVGISG